MQGVFFLLGGKMHIQEDEIVNEADGRIVVVVQTLNEVLANEAEQFFSVMDSTELVLPEYNK